MKEKGMWQLVFLLQKPRMVTRKWCGVLIPTYGHFWISLRGNFTKPPMFGKEILEVFTACGKTCLLVWILTQAIMSLTAFVVEAPQNTFLLQEIWMPHFIVAAGWRPRLLNNILITAHWCLQFTHGRERNVLSWRNGVQNVYRNSHGSARKHKKLDWLWGLKLDWLWGLKVGLIVRFVYGECLLLSNPPIKGLIVRFVYGECLLLSNPPINWKKFEFELVC